MWRVGVAPFTCGSLGPIQEAPTPLDQAFTSGAEALRRCLLHTEYSGTTSMPSHAFQLLQVVPVRHSFSHHSPPASLSTEDPPGEPSLQPPGTTLEILVDIDLTDCYPQQQQLSRPPPRYPQQQRSAQQL